jgi:hypothetical protein
MAFSIKAVELRVLVETALSRQLEVGKSEFVPRDLRTA